MGRGLALLMACSSPQRLFLLHLIWMISQESMPLALISFLSESQTHTPNCIPATTMSQEPLHPVLNRTQSTPTHLSHSPCSQHHQWPLSHLVLQTSPVLPLLQPTSEARQLRLLNVSNSCSSLHLYLSPSCCCRLSLDSGITP